MEIPLEPDRSRKIIHVDMDAFYATVEQRDNIELRGKAIAVTDPKGWGIIAAASYEARALGVKGGMTAKEALKILPKLIIVPARLEIYQKVSAEVHKIFLEYTSIVEPIFLDEAYLDVSDNASLSASDIAKEIRKRIDVDLGLKASAGVSYNKFLAKLASDYIKPDGLLVIRPSQGSSFIENLEIERFHGVGKATAVKMDKLGIKTGRDLRNHSLKSLIETFGKMGKYFHLIGNGDDDRPVISFRERKSFGVEKSFKKPLRTKEEIDEGFNLIISEIWKKCVEYGKCGRHIIIKIRYVDFSTISNGRTLQSIFKSEIELKNACKNVFEKIEVTNQSLRLIGISIGILSDRLQEDKKSEIQQLGLFD